MRIAIVDYGMGNIHSLRSSLSYVSPNSEIVLTSDESILSSSNLIFLPGVGHFKSAMMKLESKGLIQVLRNLVIQEKKPIMGICLGMQLLFKNSSEGGINSGLALLDSEVREIKKGTEKVPHMGFDSVVPPPRSRMFRDIEKLDFYFVHSYCVNDRGLKKENVTYCNYNQDFVAAVESRNIWGTQFHPEKSQYSGLKLLQNFIEYHGN